MHGETRRSGRHLDSYDMQRGLLNQGILNERINGEIWIRLMTGQDPGRRTGNIGNDTPICSVLVIMNNMSVLLYKYSAWCFSNIQCGMTQT
jgi:hypothetical protein